MALTAAQKADIRFYLGWSAQYAQTDSKLERAFGAVSTDAEHEALVLAVIADLKVVDAAIVDARSRLKATKVGSIELDALGIELTGLYAEGRRLATRVAAQMGVEVRHDVFGTASPPPTSWNGPAYLAGDRNFVG